MSAKRDFTPLYIKVKENLLGLLNSGDLKPGDALPSEAQLSAQYNVSRITIRRALKELIQLGILYTLQGKGTFMAHAPIREMSGFQSFTADIISKGLKPSSTLLRFQMISAEQEVASHLHISVGTQVYILQRLRLANDEPVAVETAYLPAHLFPGLENHDLSQSLYQILRDVYGVHPAWADAEIQSIAANFEIAQSLGMRVGEPVLKAHRLTFTDAFEVVEYVISVYCGNRFTFYTGRQSIS